MVFRYPSRVDFLSCDRLSLVAMKSSESFREKVRSWVRYMTFTYCWVIVEPPCNCWPRAMLYAARAMLDGEMPGLVQKVRSSAAMTASWTVFGIWANGTDRRFCSENVPSTCLPSE